MGVDTTTNPTSLTPVSYTHLHVKEHPFAAGPDVGRRVAVRPEAVVARGVVFAGIFVKTVVNGIPPVVGSFARESGGKQGYALEGICLLYTSRCV